MIMIIFYMHFLLKCVIKKKLQESMNKLKLNITSIMIMIENAWKRKEMKEN